MSWPSQCVLSQDAHDWLFIGCTRQGHFEHGMLNGQGELTLPNKSFKGQFKNGSPHGKSACTTAA